MNIKIYTPNREQSMISIIKDIMSGFVQGNELAWRLFIRDMKAGYRKSFLGFFWLFLPPFATSAVWIFLRSQKVVAIQNTPMSYIAFTLCGTLMWSLFVESITKPILRHQSAMPMMTKLNFPREAIVLAAWYDVAFGYIIRLLVLVPVLWLLGYPPTWYFLPGLLMMLCLAMGGLAIGIFLSPLGLLYTDIGRGLPLILPFAMYLTPVIYPLSTTGFFARLQVLNPVTPFIERSRSFLGGYDFTMYNELLGWSVVFIFMGIVGLITIKVALPIIVERSGS